jgi:hypothetical protein
VPLDRSRTRYYPAPGRSSPGVRMRLTSSPERIIGKVRA